MNAAVTVDVHSSSSLSVEHFALKITAPAKDKCNLASHCEDTIPSKKRAEWKLSNEVMREHVYVTVPPVIVEQPS